MGTTEYTYAQGFNANDRLHPIVKFRKSERGIEVFVIRKLSSPEFKGVKRFQKELKNATKNMREAKITTEISTMNEYFHEETEATLLIMGWIPLTSNDHKKALAEGSEFFSK